MLRRRAAAAGNYARGGASQRTDGQDRTEPPELIWLFSFEWASRVVGAGNVVLGESHEKSAAATRSAKRERPEEARGRSICQRNENET